jgi:DNA/RNA-binding domain of Phe-tRNA-synthetase-like protein
MELLGIHVEHAVPELALGVVVARGCGAADQDGVDRWVSRQAHAARAPGHGESQKAAVRALLRHGAYKPTGRGKPASEYLLQAALEDRFPRIMPLVDVANAVSLATLLPISLLDLAGVPTGRLCVRRGRAGERYVFNRSGQEMDLEDLLLVSTLPDDTARANPVKDSMATKLTPTASNVVAVLYGPVSLRRQVEAACQELQGALLELCHAQQCAHGGG